MASLTDVRAWAREQGMQVGDRGRLPAKLVAQYEAAHPQAAAQASPPAKKARAQKGQPGKPAKPRSRATATGSAARPSVEGAKARGVAPALVGSEADSAALAASPAPVDNQGAEAVKLRADLSDELGLVRGEVAQLRKHLDEVLGRLVELEQPRGLFNRPKARR